MSSSSIPQWSARMGSVMRRTSSLFTLSRLASVSSERDTDNSSLSGRTRSRESSTPISPPSVVTPSIAEFPLHEAEAQEPIGTSPLAQRITSSEVVPPTLPPPVEEPQSPTSYIPHPVIDSTAADPGAFTDVGDEFEPDITQNPQVVAPVEPYVEPEAKIFPSVVTSSIVESPLREATAEGQETVGPSPLAKPITPSSSRSRWSARMGSVPSEFPISSPSPVFSEIDTDGSLLSGSTRGRKSSTLNPPFSAVIRSPRVPSPLRQVAAQAQETVDPFPLPHPITSSDVVPPTFPPPVEETESPTGYNIPPPSIHSTVGDPGAFIDISDELEPDIAQDPQAVAPVEPHIEPATLDAQEPADSKPEAVTLPSVVITPSIAESPLRKAAAEGQETVDLSPLAEPITLSEVVPPTLLPPVEETESPTGYIPPNIINSTVGKSGAFTDIIDELPQPDIVRDPHAFPLVEPYFEHVALNVPEPAEPEVIATEALVDESTSYLDEPIAESIKDFEPVDHADNTPEFSEAVHGNDLITEALVDEPTSYFDEPIAESIKDFEPVDHVDNTSKFGEAVHGNANDISPEPRHEQNGEAAEYYRGDIIPTTDEVLPENTNVVLPEPNSGQREGLDAHPHDDAVPIVTDPERQEEPQQITEPISIPVLIPVPNHPMTFGSKREVWSGEHDHGAYPSSVPVVNSSSEDVERAERSPAPNIGMPFIDPFADPVAPRFIVSQPVHDTHQPEFADNYHQGSTETHSHGPIVPSFVNVAASKRIHHTPSKSSLKNGITGYVIETDETLPLLSYPGTPSNYEPTSYLRTSANPQSRNLVSISPLVYSASKSTTSNGNANFWRPHDDSHPTLHTLGWLEYHLSDGTVYYVHPANRVTTEIDLRSERMLIDVEWFLADYSKDQSSSAMEGTLTSGGEIWLRDAGTAKSGLVLERWLVDHRSRTVVMVGNEYEHTRKGFGKGKAKTGVTVFSEDQLDKEYKYWSFMEAHSAHSSLPAKAKMEAMDALTSAWTERLLPSHRAVPAPFTQEECQELMMIIRSFGDDHDDHRTQVRIVSRVFLRVAHWRQIYFRPNKPLPTNVIVDFAVSCLFLGIPYIFFERTRLSSRIDEGSGLRYATPTLDIGSCTCLVAAVVLHASGTFLSLPGLDAFSRSAGMVAILFAAFSMAATGLAIFRHKADLERPISHVGIEGMMVITRRIVILSLPMVLLVYSIIAFITGVVLYSFRGVTLLSIDDERIF